jgi:hypothetical protein
MQSDRFAREIVPFLMLSFAARLRRLMRKPLGGAKSSLAGSLIESRYMTASGILENLISDVLFILLAAILGWIIYRVSRRAKLLKFFGVDKSHRLTVYLSNLRVKSFGAIGIDGWERSYQGSAVAFGEMIVANRFRDLFNYLLPSLSDNPGLLSKLLISDVQVQLTVSPLDNAQTESSASFVTLGSPAYNVASGFVESQLHSKAKFGFVTSETSAPSFTPPQTPSNAGAVYTGATGTYSVLNLPTSGSAAYNAPQPPVPPSGIYTPARRAEQVSAIIVDGVSPMTDSTYGFVERIIDHDKKRAIFYTAGISELATAGAAHYLISGWEKLHRKYGTETGFLVVLRFEPQDYKRWTVVFEK